MNAVYTEASCTNNSLKYNTSTWASVNYAHLKINPPSLTCLSDRWLFIINQTGTHLSYQFTGSHETELYLPTDNPCCTPWPDINLKRVMSSGPFLAQKWPRLPCSCWSESPIAQHTLTSLHGWDLPSNPNFFHHSLFEWTHYCGKSVLHVTLAVHFPFLSIQILLYHPPGNRPQMLAHLWIPTILIITIVLFLILYCIKLC